MHDPIIINTDINWFETDNVYPYLIYLAQAFIVTSNQI